MSMDHGTQLSSVLNRCKLDHENPAIACWMWKSDNPKAWEVRERLYYNLSRSGQRSRLQVQCNRGKCVNPLHCKKVQYISEGWPYPYDHPEIANRWALLVWYLQGHKDYELVSLEDAREILQEETRLQSVHTS